LVSLSKLGDLARERGEREEAARLYDESLSLARQLADQLGTPTAWADVVLAAGRVASDARGTDRAALFDEAERALLQAKPGLVEQRYTALSSWIAGLRGRKAPLSGARPKKRG
jgi:hypothetical protein